MFPQAEADILIKLVLFYTKIDYPNILKIYSIRINECGVFVVLSVY